MWCMCIHTCVHTVLSTTRAQSCSVCRMSPVSEPDAKFMKHQFLERRRWRWSGDYAPSCLVSHRTERGLHCKDPSSLGVQCGLRCLSIYFFFLAPGLGTSWACNDDCPTPTAQLTDHGPRGRADGLVQRPAGAGSREGGAGGPSHVSLLPIRPGISGIVGSAGTGDHGCTWEAASLGRAVSGNPGQASVLVQLLLLQSHQKGTETLQQVHSHLEVAPFIPLRVRGSRDGRAAGISGPWVSSAPSLL